MPREFEPRDLEHVENSDIEVPEVAAAEANTERQPTLDELDLERSLPRVRSIESDAKREYFRFLQGRSELQREIRAEFGRRRGGSGRLEEVLLEIIRVLISGKRIERPRRH